MSAYIKAVEAVRLARGVWARFCTDPFRPATNEDRELLALLDQCAEELGDTRAVGIIIAAGDAREIALDAWKAVEAWRRAKAVAR